MADEVTDSYRLYGATLVDYKKFILNLGYHIGNIYDRIYELYVLTGPEMVLTVPQYILMGEISGKIFY
jgi:hypothetical protein